MLCRDFGQTRLTMWIIVWSITIRNLNSDLSLLLYNGYNRTSCYTVHRMPAKPEELSSHVITNFGFLIYPLPMVWGNREGLLGWRILPFLHNTEYITPFETCTCTSSEGLWLMKTPLMTTLFFNTRAFPDWPLTHDLAPIKRGVLTPQKGEWNMIQSWCRQTIPLVFASLNNGLEFWGNFDLEGE